MSLLADLREALGATAVQAPTGSLDDIAGFDLGTPATTVRPASTHQVCRVLQIARTHRAPVVPVGHRTAYWSPLRLEGAIALHLHALSDHALADGVVSVGAGTPTRTLDAALREQGRALPVHPDAFGETTVGSMVSTGLTSGIGMAHGGVDRWLTGLTVVTGTGDVLHTGTAHTFDDTPPFLRDGLPDLTGLFLGSEGTLGIVTEVHLRTRPAPAFTHLVGELTSDPAGVRRLLDTLRPLLEEGWFDTVRLTREAEAGTDPLAAPWRWSAWLEGTDPERDLRLAHLRRLCSDAGLPEPRRAPSSHDDPRWQGPMGHHLSFMRSMWIVGLDVNAPWSTLDDLLEIADGQAADAASLQPTMVRSALYLSPDFLNLGLHTTVPRTGDATACHDHQNRWLRALADLPVVPYRPGHTWPRALLDRRRTPDVAILRAIKTALDPDHILNPHHPLFA